ncbi:MAG: hypothetical protein ACUVUQ_10105, partial [Thermodesulfovibrionales bacterium]
VRRAIEKLKSQLRKFDYYSIIEVGFWEIIWPQLDKELLTYKQKKMVAHALFPIIEELKRNLGYK